MDESALGPSIDLTDLMESTLGHAPSRELLAQIPSAERRRVLDSLGRLVYRHNVGNYAAELRYNSDPVIETGQLPGFDGQRERHVGCLLAYLSDLIDFSTVERSERHLAETTISVAGLEFFRPHVGSRPVILLGAHLSHRAYGLSEVLRHGADLAVVWRMAKDDRGSTIESWSADVRRISADTRGAVDLLRHLRRGGVVGVYNDFAFQGARHYRGFLFGRPVPASLALLEIARRTGAIIIPFAIARRLPVERDEVEVHYFPPLPHSVCYNSGSLDALAMEASLATECMIRRFPIQWRLWNSLRMRWDRATMEREPRAAEPGR